MKQFDEWFGGWGCEGNPPRGYETHKEAERTMFSVIEQMEKTRGIECIQVRVIDREGNGRYWVHNTSTYDPDAKM